MKSIYELKPAFQNLLRPLTKWLAQIGVTANQITVIALLLSLGAGFLITIYPENHKLLLIIPGVLFVRMALNAIDGMLARDHNMKSSLGAILNEIGDVLSDSFLYLPFALIPGFSPILIVSCVFFAIMTEMMGVVAIQIGASRRYDGPMGKSDRAFIFGLMALLIGLGVKIGNWVIILLWIIAILTVITIINRGRKALKEIKE